MSEPAESVSKPPMKKPEKVKLIITLPTKEMVINELTKLFPAITVEVEGGKTEEPPTDETTTETAEPTEEHE